jgi:hypothetical protein
MANLFDAYFNYCADTEPPLIFHRWSMIGCVGAMLGRQYYFPHGSFQIYPNQYIQLIGDPGTRKSTAIKMAAKMLSAAGYTTFAADRTSKEKFLIDLEGTVGDDGQPIPSMMMDDFLGTAQDPKEVCIVADEFNQFVGHGNLEFLSLLGILWDWNDETKPFTQRLKTSRSVSIYQPTVSLVSGNTHSGFAEAFPPQAMGQGFLSRMIFIFGERSGRKITFPTTPSLAQKQAVVDQLVEIRKVAVGEATMTKQAREMLEVIYRNFEGLHDVRFSHYSTRRFTHLLKLVLTITAIDLRTEINAKDVLLANTLLSYAEHFMPQALGEYGKARNADVAIKIMTLLQNSKLPVPMSELWKQVSSDLDKPQALNEIISNLMTSNKIQFVEATKGYLPVREQLQNKVYVDYSLLKEYNERKI